jgi:hypothetical protein
LSAFIDRYRELVATPARSADARMLATQVLKLVVHAMPPGCLEEAFQALDAQLLSHAPPQLQLFFLRSLYSLVASNFDYSRKDRCFALYTGLAHRYVDALKHPRL